MTHANVNTASFTEEAIVEVLLVGLRDCGGITDRVSILVLGVAVPHGIKRFFAGKEIVRLALHHIGVAHFDSDSVVSALAVAVTKETNFTRGWDDALNIYANVMFSSSLLLEMQLVVHEFIVVCLWVSTHILIIVIII